TGGGDVAGGPSSNLTFRNMGYGFEWMHGYQTAPYFGGGPVTMFGPVNLTAALGAMAFGDVNGDGLIDVIFPQVSGVTYYVNKTRTNNRSFVVEVVGPNGEQNQQGRVVTISPLASRNASVLAPAQTYTRVVESGSGYM